MSKLLHITSEHDGTADDRFPRHVTAPLNSSFLFFNPLFCVVLGCVCGCVLTFLFCWEVTEGLIKKAGNSSLLKKAPVQP